MARKGITRRDFLTGGAIAGATLGIPVPACAQEGPKIKGPGRTSLRLTVNGKSHEIEIDPRATLLRVLRNTLRLTGAKEVCDRGACGACTVLLDGRAVNSCLVLALDAEGSHVETVEGLAKEGTLSAVQRAFAAWDAFQCGYCTPGMILSAEALLRRTRNPSASEIREAVRGNLCRCAAYPNIFAAIDRAARMLREGK